MAQFQNLTSLTLKKNQKGVVTTEFSIGFIFLFYALVVWVEICVMGYVSSVIDYAISESSRVARTSANADYEALFKSALAQSDQLWVKIVNPDKFDVSVRYFDSFSQASNSLNTGGEDRTNNPIALYRISYDYDPIFAYFFDDSKVTLSREVFGLQEFERDEFSQ
ncbi:TadE/TadG family type IV pilus assembly protein [Enterovibrio norvegicus]|uniref:Pilus assembly protein TadE n=1 Tax=Enterovibrio norvegicus TaxID=188144 RepID=A0A2N7L807_9GAMM|nr:pilus assembly protein TadE [Enterovibrio norvegicus]PMN71900.1 pilus assembly protein TadE [Enterovibrio norvegicus]PMN90268.1 pilus assembly protein TadE [Enterovibrio norvegicus]